MSELCGLHHTEQEDLWAAPSPSACSSGLQRLSRSCWPRANEASNPSFVWLARSTPYLVERSLWRHLSSLQPHVANANDASASLERQGVSNNDVFVSLRTSSDNEVTGVFVFSSTFCLSLALCACASPSRHDDF